VELRGGGRGLWRRVKGGLVARLGAKSNTGKDGNEQRSSSRRGGVLLLRPGDAKSQCGDTGVIGQDRRIRRRGDSLEARESRAKK